MDSNEREQLIVIHCRADRVLNMERLAKALAAPSPPIRLSSEDISKFGMEYGLVNPFAAADEHSYRVDPHLLDIAFTLAPVKQLFDSDVIGPVGTPGTMMTNAGSLTWAVEFRPRELAVAVHARVEDVADPDPNERGRPWGVRGRRPIGIITGNPPESGIELWRTVNSTVRRLLGRNCIGDFSMPQVTIRSLPELGLSMELDRREEDIRSALADVARELCRSDIQLIAIADPANHYFAPLMTEICNEHGVEFVPLAETTAKWLHANQIRQVALVGVKQVADQGNWSPYSQALAGIKVERISERGLVMVKELAYRVKTEGTTVSAINRFRDLVQQEFASRDILLAAPELAAMAPQQRSRVKGNRVFIDPMKIYGDYIAHRYLNWPWLSEPDSDQNNQPSAGV
jgi:aspartate racemase